MFGRRHQRRQDVCLLAETNSVNDERLVAGTIHAESPDTAEAWFLDSNQQCKDEKTGRYIQFLSSLNCKPIPIYKNLPTSDIDSALISSQTEDQEMTFISLDRQKGSALLWVGIIVSMLTLGVLVAGLIVVGGS